MRWKRSLEKDLKDSFRLQLPRMRTGVLDEIDSTRASIPGTGKPGFHKVERDLLVKMDSEIDLAMLSLRNDRPSVSSRIASFILAHIWKIAIGVIIAGIVYWLKWK